MLYYQFLHAKSHDEFYSIPAAYADKCSAYAAGLCEIIYAAHSTPGCDVLYNMIGHVLMIASTVQIHQLLNSSSEDEIVTTRRCLERNFEIILRLYNLWPALAMCLLRLRIFHTACWRSMTETFLMDCWMLRFLRESGRAVDKRANKSPEDIPFSLTGIGLQSELMKTWKNAKIIAFIFREEVPEKKPYWYSFEDCQRWLQSSSRTIPARSSSTISPLKPTNQLSEGWTP